MLYVLHYLCAALKASTENVSIHATDVFKSRKQTCHCGQILRGAGIDYSYYLFELLQLTSEKKKSDRIPLKMPRSMIVVIFSQKDHIIMNITLTKDNHF